MTRWTADDIPDLTGRTAVVTGANSGLGLRTTEQLARHGADVVMAVRDVARGERAAGAIGEPARLRVARLDLADLESVRSFAADLGAAPLDLLFNNAGVMAIPPRTTAQGFEMQLGTNHLGHVALTGLLLDNLLAVSAARVVTTSSFLARSGRVDPDRIALGDLGSYDPRGAYSRSKLANLLFAFELDRRVRAAGFGLISAAAHPGYAATNLQGVGPQMRGSKVEAVAMAVANRLLAQPDSRGALPQLYAGTAPGVQGGDYIGPDRLGGVRGLPTRVQAPTAARDPATAARLWEVSNELVGARFERLDRKEACS